MSNVEKPYPGAVYLPNPPINKAKLKIPTAIPIYPAEFYSHVGMISLCWGAYENHFNRLLRALIHVTNDTSEPNWEHGGYKRRKKLCRKNLAIHFSSMPNIRKYLEKILDDSAKYFVDRNAILHGKTVARLTAMPDATVKCELYAESRINGEITGKFYTADDLETISHEILHIMGRLNLTFNNPIEGLTSNDLLILKDFFETFPIRDQLQI